MSRNDDPMMVTVFEGLGDNEALWEDRNRLAIALRIIVSEIEVGDTLASIRDAAFGALSDVFPGDPLGEKPLYDCPDAHGRNRLREELDAD